MIELKDAAALPAPSSDGLCEPVAWRVKDFADGWVLFDTEARARRYAEGAGNLTQALYPDTALRSRDARIAELEAALKPFAKEARLWTEYDDAEAIVEGFPNGPASIITVGHLRAARASLTKEQTDGE